MIYIYIKRHSVTGLKYFGATRRDPFKYCGSGKKWKNHLRKNGRLVETLYVRAFSDQDEAMIFALSFSKANDIVSSDKWANLIEEDALSKQVSHKWTDEQRRVLSETAKARMTPEKREALAILARNREPTFTGRKHSETSKKAMSDAKKGSYVGEENHFWGKRHTEEAKSKMSKSSSGRVKTSETRRKLSDALTGKTKSETQRIAISTYSQRRRWIVNNDGKVSHCIDENDPRLLSGHWKFGKKWVD